jgi:hypothetical protein
MASINPEGKEKRIVGWESGERTRLRQFAIAKACKGPA